MSALGRITNSIFSGTNENTLALASINVDFSLLKFEAPREYVGLGTALSHRRRIDAEEGPLHQTARKLGAVFEKKIPSTPTLVKAYGSRASTIFETPGVNPRGSRSDGPFESFVGADGTSIWAAATSGSAAIAVHLLACMLARMWTAKEATSIWAELLIERKREIEAAAKQGDSSSMTISLTGALDISRDELRLWDASARSWLQSADVAKFSEQKRLELILKNINVPVATGATTYSRVINAWTQAMNGLEHLINGTPQRICDGAILLALTAWHIFPDLLVLGQKTVNVQFQDSLVPRSGVVTVGLHSTLDEEKEIGIKWSLALSHLRYYGDPVEVASDELKSRVTIEELHLVAFGSLLSLWKFPSYEANLVAVWLTALWEQIQKAPQVSEIKLDQHMSWLWILVLAAQKLLSSHGEELEVNIMLVKWGHRRGKTFLGAIEGHVPLFGLNNIAVLSALTEKSSLEREIRYLREVAKLIGAKSDDSIITATGRNADHFGMATAVPHTINSQKRSRNGEVRDRTTHARWLGPGEDRSRTSFCTKCKGNCGDRCPCSKRGVYCTRRCHQALSNDKIHCQTFQASFSCRFIEAALEAEFFCDDVNSEEGFSWTALQNTVEWMNPPLLYTDLKRPACGPSTKCHSEEQLPCNCFERCSSNHQGTDVAKCQISHHAAVFDTVLGKNKSVALRLKRCKPKRVYHKVIQCLEAESANCDVRKATEWTTRLDPSSLFEFFSFLVDEAKSPQRPDKFLLSLDRNFLPQNLLWSLQALSISHHLYKSLPGATIPLITASRALCEANWMTQEEVQWSNSPSSRTFPTWPISRAQAFACISMLETGALNITPSSLQSVMAMSSGNSIYIAAPLLSDPFEENLGCNIKRITGNVGFSGIVMMIPPQEPRVRKLGEDLHAVQHARYNFQREDNFEGTTLHLSFTNWKLPLDVGSRGTIEQDVYFVESVISVHDRGAWVADLDILTAEHTISRLQLECKCTEDKRQQFQKLDFAERFISVDCWEELLDAPGGTGVIRARGNWAARRAAVAILARQGAGQVAVIGERMPCLQCLSHHSKGIFAYNFLID